MSLDVTTRKYFEHHLGWEVPTPKYVLSNDLIQTGSKLVTVFDDLWNFGGAYDDWLPSSADYIIPQYWAFKPMYAHAHCSGAGDTIGDMAFWRDGAIWKITRGKTAEKDSYFTPVDLGDFLLFNGDSISFYYHSHIGTPDYCSFYVAGLAIPSGYTKGVLSNVRW